jgi:hypothetical protein
MTEYTTASTRLDCGCTFHVYRFTAGKVVKYIFFDDLCVGCMWRRIKRMFRKANRGGNHQPMQSTHKAQISGRQNTSAKEAKRNICGTGAASQWAAPGFNQ